MVKKPPTLSEMAYRKIRQKILSGEIRPGDRMSLEKFSSEFGMSATPVRESLTKLEQDGLVYYLAHSGWRASKLSRKTYVKYRELQFLLESALATRAAPFVDEKVLKHMKESNERMRQAIKTMPKEEIARIIQKENDDHFHLPLYRACDNEPMLKVLLNVWDTIRHQRMAMFSSPEFLKRCCNDHDLIIKALEKKDLFALQEAVNLHFASGLGSLESSFDDPDQAAGDVPARE